MNKLKYIFLVLLLFVLFILFGIGKCEYEKIDHRISEGNAYGLSIGDSFEDVITVLKKVPSEYPNSVLHFSNGEGDSTPIEWDSINQLNPSKGLFVIYDTHSNYLDFLDISFNQNKAKEIHRLKFCSLNPKFKKSHRWIADLLGVNY